MIERREFPNYFTMRWSRQYDYRLFFRLFDHSCFLKTPLDLKVLVSVGICIESKIIKTNKNMFKSSKLIKSAKSPFSLDKHFTVLKLGEAKMRICILIYE